MKLKDVPTGVWLVAVPALAFLGFKLFSPSQATQTSQQNKRNDVLPKPKVVFMFSRSSNQQNPVFYSTEFSPTYQDLVDYNNTANQGKFSPSIGWLDQPQTMADIIVAPIGYEAPASTPLISVVTGDVTTADRPVHSILSKAGPQRYLLTLDRNLDSPDTVGSIWDAVESVLGPSHF